MQFVEVILDIPLFKSFDYIIKDKISIGCRVSVPFGNREKIGIVIGIKEKSSFELKKLKEISRIIDDKPIFSTNFIVFLNWLNNYYHYPKGEVYFNALPKILKNGTNYEIPKITFWQLTEEGKNCSSLGRAKKQFNIIKYMQNIPGKLYSESELVNKGGIKNIREILKEKGLIKSKEEEDSSHKQKYIKESQKSFNLTDEQQTAINKINEYSDKFKVIVLQGVTGSGKTEVYLQSIQHTIECGKQALILIPEIGLTPQTVARFQNFFPNAKISILHSKLSSQERYKHWVLAKEGISDIVIGTRSAIFTPLKNPGLFIIDESHDLSYKQQDSFRYSAKDSLIKRASIDICPIVLGTATPSIESIYNINNEKFIRLSLSKRVDDSEPPKIKVIDLKGKKNPNGISSQLIHKIQEHLDKKGQILLFLNRRGYAPIFMCFDCGWTAGCTNCDTKLITHQGYNQLRCHHCEIRITIPKKCPDCNSESIKPLGFGTEKIEERLKECFPNNKIQRIDKDSTSRKDDLINIINNIKEKNIDIILGTQMISKGHHFPDVTLVGILDVDSALFSSDFRSIERLGQLVTQVAGRAGRGLKQGEVILQTMHPEHYMLKKLLSSGYDELCKSILEERQMCSLPPFNFQTLIRAIAKNNNEALSFLNKLKKAIEKSEPTVEILGPISAPIERKINNYHYQLLIQSTKRATLHKTLKRAIQYIEGLKINRVFWSIDVDPMEML